MDSIEKLIFKYQRTGEQAKARWLESAQDKIPPSFRQRIMNNDKSVLRELIMPDWMSWDLLRQCVEELEVKKEAAVVEQETPKVVDIEALILKYQRTGEQAKARWLESMDKKIPPSFKERIKNNDKSITRELILPEWVTWDILRSWANQDE